MIAPRMICIDDFWVSEIDVLCAVLEAAVAHDLTVCDLMSAASLDDVEKIEDLAESIDALIELNRSVRK